jgi:hypothetical protein
MIGRWRRLRTIAFLEALHLDKLDFWCCLGGVSTTVLRNGTFVFFLILLSFLVMCIRNATRAITLLQSLSGIGIFMVLIYALCKKIHSFHPHAISLILDILVRARPLKKKVTRSTYSGTRLDPALANSDRNMMFQLATPNHKTASTWDHCPILLQLEPILESQYSAKNFNKYELLWESHENFRDNLEAQCTSIPEAQSAGALCRVNWGICPTH